MENDNKENTEKKKISRKELRRRILRASEGLLSTVTDLILYQFLFVGSIGGGGKTSKAVYRAVREADDALYDINYQTIKRSLAYLKKKGWIRTLKEPVITAEGQKRLRSKIPVYQTERTWDGHIYLITYDIPEEEKRTRDKLREILTKVGAGMLQASVWLTPYNPEKILQEFHQETGEAGEIIVSCIGKDGYIGKKTIKELISRVYNLSQLNLDYKNFIASFKGKKKVQSWQAAASYLCILQEDPQLPWELLPNDWLGDKAYFLYKKVIDRR